MGEALATLVVNKIRGVLNVCAIKAPGFGERRKSLLQDIAIVTGSTYLAKDLGMSVSGATMEDLGYARKVTVKNNTTTIIADAASKVRPGGVSIRLHHVVLIHARGTRLFGVSDVE